MFGIFKRKKLFVDEAQQVFIKIQAKSRDVMFYRDLQVPDTTEGRFDILTLHMFMIIERMKNEPEGKIFSQNLFDEAFSSIDRGYREIGVGDMGIPKRMKKLMLSFNGRLHAYSGGIASYKHDNGVNLYDALERNIFDVVDLSSYPEVLPRLGNYVMGNMQYLHSLDTQDIIHSNFEFKNLE